MTNQTNWKEYTGTDEQNVELDNARHGLVLKYKDGSFSGILTRLYNGELRSISRYWIIPDDPLREMKIRQAQTGQPVWIRYKSHKFDWDSILGNVMVDDLKTEITTKPDWDIPNAEYSFSPFEE